MFKDLVPDGQIQSIFFDRRDRKRSEKLMLVLDRINGMMGSGTLKYAAVGLGRNQRWQTVFERRSPAYTTNWDQLLKVS